MSRLFSSLRNSLSGVQAHSKLMEVASHNVANASNEEYTRQEAQLTSQGLSVGGGVRLASLRRVHDAFLEGSLVEATARAEFTQTKSEGLSRLESLYGEPSEYGVSRSLSDFWSAWSHLSLYPDDLSARSQLAKRSDQLAQSVRTVDHKLDQLEEEHLARAEETLREIHSLGKRIADLNGRIFEMENSMNSEAHDLRDQREQLIRELSGKALFDVQQEENGMVFLSLKGHAFVYRERVEELSLERGEGPSRFSLAWEGGAAPISSDGEEIQGSLGSLMESLNLDLPGEKSSLDDFARSLIGEVNTLYVNGVGKGEREQMSFGGYEALGVSNGTEPLSLVPEGEKRELHIAFHNEEGEIVRSSGILLTAEDSLESVRNKLDRIPGLQAEIIISGQTPGRLSLAMEDANGENILGEHSFSFSPGEKSEEEHTTLSMLGFSAVEKTENGVDQAPQLFSENLDQLLLEKGKESVEMLMDEPLGLSEDITLNLFEQATESSGTLDGSHLLQIRIEVNPSDSLRQLIDRVNEEMNLPSHYGITLSLDEENNRLVWSSSLKTDSKGELLFPPGNGTHAVRLSFSSGYFPQHNPADLPPKGYNGLGDNSGLLARIGMNTFFSGQDASSFVLRSEMYQPEKIAVGYSSLQGDADLTRSLVNLRSEKVSIGGREESFSSFYEGKIAELGEQTASAQIEREGEALYLESLTNEKLSQSGVNLDEELAKLITYQRSYQSNAKVMATISELLGELIGLV